MTCRVVVLLLLPATTAAQATRDTSVSLRFGAFVDAYYAWDTGRPASFDRSFASGTPFTTQPARHNEFNVNLAFVEAALEGTRVHGRIALQAGTSVVSNYAAEPATGTISGPLASRVIQEAFAGAKLSESLWIDAGIFFSHLGMESWISRDNPTYTRSLVAEYSPYYASGARAVWRPSGNLTGHLHVVNGWQNVSENNSGKGAGIRADFRPRDGVTLSYYNFFSSEAGNLLRSFHGVGLSAASRRLTFLSEADYGIQDGASGGPSGAWYGLLAILRIRLSPTIAVATRAERYDDESQVIAATGTAGAPLQANGLSVGVDVAPMPRFVWRSEVRAWRNRSAVFPGTGGVPRKSNGVLVSSLALTF